MRTVFLLFEMEEGEWRDPPLSRSWELLSHRAACSGPLQPHSDSCPFGLCHLQDLKKYFDSCNGDLDPEIVKVRWVLLSGAGSCCSETQQVLLGCPRAMGKCQARAQGHSSLHSPLCTSC